MLGKSLSKKVWRLIYAFYLTTYVTYAKILAHLRDHVWWFYGNYKALIIPVRFSYKNITFHFPLKDLDLNTMHGWPVSLMKNFFQLYISTIQRDCNLLPPSLKIWEQPSLKKSIFFSFYIIFTPDCYWTMKEMQY